MVLSRHKVLRACHVEIHMPELVLYGAGVIKGLGNLLIEGYIMV